MGQPDFESLASALAAAGSMDSPSEMHGYAAGSCCGPTPPDAATFIQRLADHLEIPATALQAMDELPGLLGRMEGSLSSPELGFYPLLPDDDYSLAERTAALGQWCEGFLAGYAWQLGHGGRVPSAEVQEILSDLVAIARVGVPEDDEDDETSLAEIIEYLRMAAISLFLEARTPSGRAPGPAPALH